MRYVKQRRVREIFFGKSPANFDQLDTEEMNSMLLGLRCD